MKTSLGFEFPSSIRPEMILVKSSIVNMNMFSSCPPLKVKMLPKIMGLRLSEFRYCLCVPDRRNFFFSLFFKSTVPALLGPGI